jgi:hypothetical protein
MTFNLLDDGGGGDINTRIRLQMLYENLFCSIIRELLSCRWKEQAI